jgi:hypothetical protein
MDELSGVGRQMMAMHMEVIHMTKMEQEEGGVMSVPHMGQRGKAILLRVEDFG